MIFGTIQRTEAEYPGFDLLRVHRNVGPAGCRTTWTRLNRLCSLALANQLGNLSSLAAQFGVCEKTIHRDVHYLVHEMRLPIRFDSVQRRYVTLHPNRDEAADQRCREFAFRFSAPKPARKGGKG